MHADEPHRTAQLDATRLRALAHPLRVQLLGALRLDGAATATALAKRFGHNSANTSWHLRQLAAAGLVTEDLHCGNQRERWWTAAQQQTRVDVVELGRDPELAGALTTYLHGVNAVHHDQANTYLATMNNWPEHWRQTAELSDYQLHLSHSEATELNRRITELIEDFRRAPKDGDTDVVVHWHALPQRGPDGPAR